MKKYIGAAIVSIVLAYMGYLIHEDLTELQYAFATIWGAIMVILDFKTMEILDNN